jgi:hypothetical protein
LQQALLHALILQFVTGSRQHVLTVIKMLAQLQGHAPCLYHVQLLAPAAAPPAAAAPLQSAHHAAPHRNVQPLQLLLMLRLHPTASRLLLGLLRPRCPATTAETEHL